MQSFETPLSQIIRTTIEKSGGFIDFAQYMEMVLYTPEHGYYCHPHPIFGKQGDFITAPEISPIFAQCMAIQFQEILQKLPQKNILEIGAGSGIFAKEILLELEKLATLPEKYFIVERSPYLAIAQQKLLRVLPSHLFSRIVWLDALPQEFVGIIFGNEVMDAIPVHAFKIADDVIWERGVTWEKNQLTWQLRAADPNFVSKIRNLQEQFLLPNLYESEIHYQLSDWIISLGKILRQGVVLLLDYGYGRKEYYHPDRTRGTLMTFYQHRCDDNPFLFPGKQDITAHVDFTTVIESASTADMKLLGYTTQAAFLLALGLTALPVMPNEIERHQQNYAIKKLLLPSQMGELIKVMGLHKNFSYPLTGFSFSSLIRHL